MLGVGRQRVQQLINGPDFPTPVAVLAMGKIWCRADVLAWADARGRHVVNEDRSDGGQSEEPS